MQVSKDVVTCYNVWNREMIRKWIIYMRHYQQKIAGHVYDARYKLLSLSHVVFFVSLKEQNYGTTESCGMCNLIQQVARGVLCLCGSSESLLRLLLH